MLLLYNETYSENLMILYLCVNVYSYPYLF